MAMDPIRLLEQPDLSPRERAALEAGRTHAPVVYDVAAGAARLAHSLSTTTSAAATSALTLKLGVKVLAGIMLASAGVALWLRAEPAPSATVAPAPSAKPAAPAIAAEPVPTPSSAAPVAPPPREPRAAAAAPRLARSARKSHVARAPSPPATTIPELAPAPEPQTAPELEPQAAPESEPRAAVEREPQEKPVAAPSPSPAVLEMKAIARAKRALADDEPGAALAILASIARDFPRGYFIEERRALRVLALAESGESERARREASAFQRDFPNSSFTERVRKAARD
jgi:hypothetical protein